MRQTRSNTLIVRPEVSPGKPTKGWLLLLVICWLALLPTGTVAADLYIYLTPSGERVVTNRPVTLPGYVLEHSGLNARHAGQRLRDPDGLRGRAEIEQHINTAASQYQLEKEIR